jgi:hypothetical protein
MASTISEVVAGALPIVRFVIKIIAPNVHLHMASTVPEVVVVAFQTV